MAGLPLQIRMEMAILHMGLNSINRTILELRLNTNWVYTSNAFHQSNHSGIKTNKKINNLN